MFKNPFTKIHNQLEATASLRANDRRRTEVELELLKERCRSLEAALERLANTLHDHLEAKHTYTTTQTSTLEHSQTIRADHH